MSLKLNTASGGSVTIEPTNTASNYTLTVPATTGTVLTNKTAGTVLQVVQATYATETSSSSSTYADTGLTASITPTSSTSKILVLVSQNGVDKRTGNTYIGIKLLRSGSDIAAMSVVAAATGDTSINNIGTVSINYLDSPATTSSVTYKTQFSSLANIAVSYVQKDNAVSTITLMEIAA